MKFLLISFILGSYSLFPATSSNLSIGTQAPEIEMITPEKETLSLSSLKGHIVLIDFWASWCRPCRAENKNLVKTYEHYSNSTYKGGGNFKIYSVSLDKNETAWTSAIKTDKLIWGTHVCDFKGWQSDAAVAYGINSIPMNILIDQNGKIIAKNLRGKALDKVLEGLKE